MLQVKANASARPTCRHKGGRLASALKDCYLLFTCIFNQLGSFFCAQWTQDNNLSGFGVGAVDAPIRHFAPLAFVRLIVTIKLQLGGCLVGCVDDLTANNVELSVGLLLDFNGKRMLLTG